MRSQRLKRKKGRESKLRNKEKLIEQLKSKLEKFENLAKKKTLIASSYKRKIIRLNDQLSKQCKKLHKLQHRLKSEKNSSLI